MCGEDGQFTYCWHDDIMQGKVAPEVGRIVSSYLKTDLPSTNFPLQGCSKNDLGFCSHPILSLVSLQAMC